MMDTPASDDRRRVTHTLQRTTHACTLIDPDEESVLLACGDVVGRWCGRVRQRLDAIGGRVLDVTFFSFHADFCLVLGWSTPGSADAAGLPVRQRARYVPQPGAGGLSRLILEADRWGDDKALFLRPRRGEWIVGADGTMEPVDGSTGATMDEALDREIGLRDRLYLPAYGRDAEGQRRLVGAFVLHVGSSGCMPLSASLLRSLVTAVKEFHRWYEDDVVGETVPILHEVWRVAWESDRECRTRMPHQASLTRVLAAVAQDDFHAGRDAVVGVAHFDFNDFKRLNDILGYRDADRVVERFVDCLLERYAEWVGHGAWPHPVSCARGTWAALAVHGRRRPLVAWYPSRVGGDEFGLVYVAEGPVFERLRREVLDHAVRAAEEGLDAELRDRLRGAGWQLRCMGAYVEAPAAQIVPTETPGAERLQQRFARHAEQLWHYTTRLSQAVKSEFKGRLRGDASRFFALGFDQFVTECAALYPLEPASDGQAVEAVPGSRAPAWSVPFPELQQFLPIAPTQNIELLYRLDREWIVRRTPAGSSSVSVT